MTQTLSVKIIQSDWLQKILADPISKNKLIKGNGNYYTETGFSYSIKESVPDFRIRLNDYGNEWQKGQQSYEKWMVKYLDNAENNSGYYIEEQKRDAPMYQKLKLEGRVLDVGGNLGNIRKYMNEQQEYCSLDPFINVYKLATGRSNLFKNYPADQPLNFIAGYAEFLPFATANFETVNMRSCIDHFFNAELSLLEANRVLKSNGKLVIGMTVKISNAKNNIKEATRSVLNIFTNKFEDRHIWHPTKLELVDLCRKCGFEMEDEIWQDEKYMVCIF